MTKIDTSIRACLSPDAQELFDDIVTQKVLGASTHIKMISQMMRDLCSTAKAQNESADSLNERIHQLAEFFIQTRGEASQAITNAIGIMTNGSNDQSGCDLDVYIEYLLQRMDDFEKGNKRNLELINQYAQCVLSKMNSILLFDYSSTVGRMIETCNHPLEIFIAESRAFDGGKPYLPQAFKGHHKVHFIPDVAIYYYLKQYDGVFIGSETYYADGKVFNTVGTDMVASLCNTLDVPFYVLTTLIKIDIRSMYGFIKQPLILNLRNRISPELDHPFKDQIDYSCPEVVEIPSKWITAFITEAGIVPPSAMFQLSTNYLKRLGKFPKMRSVHECVSISMIQTPPLPGSFQHSRQSLDEIIDYVLKEARILSDCGFDAVILQNMGDMPVKQQARPEVIAYFSIIAKELKRNFSNFTLGILINWDGVASLAAAHAAQADFVRVEHVYTGAEVTSTGVITAQCCEITEMKKRLHTTIPIFADVYEPHAIPLGPKPIEDAAWESVNEAFADGLFLSGRSIMESIELIERARTRVPHTTIFLGGGASEENVIQLLKHYDGVCVATWIKNGSLKNPIDSERAKRFIEKVTVAKVERNKA